MTIKPYYLILGALFIAESFINYRMMVDMRIPFLKAVWFSILISCLLAFFAHKLGELYAEKSKASRKYILVLLLFTSLFIILLRFNLDVQSLILIFLNIIFIATGFAFSFFRHQHRRIFILEDSIRINNDVINKATITIQQINAEYRKQKKEIIDIENTNARNALDNQDRELANKISKLSQSIDRKKALQQKYLRMIEALKNNGLKGGANLINTIALFLFLSLTSCCITTDHSTSEISVLFDQTDSIENKYNAPKITEYVIEQSGIKKNDLANGATFRISILKDKSVSPEALIEIAPVSQKCADWVEKDREDFVSARLEKLSHTIKIIAKEDVSNRSYINRVLQYHLQQLANSKASKRLLLTNSDLIQNIPGAVNFYAYKRADDILKNYQSIADSLSKDAPLPSLSGIEIVNVFVPSSKNDELHRVAKAFWKRYWEERGATVSFITNL